MIAKGLRLSALVLAVTVGGQASAETPQGAVECADLHWSAEVLAANPDIAFACRGIYEKDGILYAKASIEVVRVTGNRMRFRTLLTNGTKGAPRSVTLDSGWRVNMSGKEYRLMDLAAGQQLDVFLPEDRFALTVLGSNDAQASSIEAVQD
jgi:hypothetical protein